MAYVITSACVGTKDRSCVAACPVDCIHPTPQADGEDLAERAEQLYINPAVCIDCGACVTVCPVQAIYAESDVPEAEYASIAKNGDWYNQTS